MTYVHVHVLRVLVLILFTAPFPLSLDTNRRGKLVALCGFVYRLVIISSRVYSLYIFLSWQLCHPQQSICVHTISPLYLYTTCYTPPQAIHHHMLYTTTCYTPPHAIHHHMLYTTTCYTPPHAIHHHMLYTTTCYTPPHAIHHHMLYTTTCYTGKRIKNFVCSSF